MAGSYSAVFIITVCCYTSRTVGGDLIMTQTANTLFRSNVKACSVTQSCDVFARSGVF